MITVLTSWAIMFAFSLIFGKSIINIFDKFLDCSILKSMDFYIVTGMVVLNVFAEYFSIFSKVGMLTWVVLIFLLIFCLIINLKELKREFIDNPPIKAAKILFLVLLAAVVAVWTVGEPVFVDTYLYHAQAIRWVEEYGVVTGLGNLHNRFAYNSAFMVFQALFSFKWMLGQSLHSLNGFITIVFAGYAVLGFQPSKKISVSNLLKLATILYSFMNRDFLSSPSSDTLALLLVLWIDTKWAELVEDKENSTTPFIYLTIVSVYAITVKLSTAAGIVFAIYPIVKLVKEKQWNKIGISTLLCVVTALPYIIRNVIISGYLLYPYTWLDFFDVDWKIPEYVAQKDRMEITVWGREVKDVSRYDENVLQWFPTWWNNNSLVYKVLLVIGIIAAIGALTYLIFLIIQKRDSVLCVMIMVNLLHFGLWFLGAPLIRYGVVYLFILPCILLGSVRWPFSKKLICYCYQGVVFIYLVYGLVSFRNYLDIPFICQADYKKCDSTIEQLGGENIYIPASSNIIGYHAFPSALTAKQLDLIELRGEKLNEGFRYK